MAQEVRERAGRHGDLTGLVALVTGGARGLGAEICRELAQGGAAVTVGDIDGTRAEEVATRLRVDDSRVDAVMLDVRDEAMARRTVEGLVEAHGRIDVLVNNAGTDVTRAFDELTMEELDRVLAVNLRGPILLSRLAFPFMKREGRGHIVNITSTAAKRAWANASAYHASKWGLLGFSHALHVEGRAVGVKVTAVVAGGMRTPFLLDRFPELDPGLLQDPATVAGVVRSVLSLPEESVVPEVMVLPMRETSWP
jgi:NAD(P)-dependent dehydrogenase (short-subunit alcohol dehydrogenase family)